MQIRVPKSTLLLFGIAALLCSILLLLVLFRFRSNSNTGQQPSSLSTPTPYSIIPPHLQSKVKTQTVSPKEDVTGKTVENPSQNVSFTLTETLSPNDVTVRVSPPLPVKVQKGTTPNSLLVLPDPPEFWKPDVLYTITIFDAEEKIISKYQIKVPVLKVPEVID